MGTSVAAAYVGALHVSIRMPPIILGFVPLAKGKLSLGEVTKEKTETPMTQGQAGQVYSLGEDKG